MAARKVQQAHRLVGCCLHAHSNPASETVTLTYRPPADAPPATLVLYDLTGRQVARHLLASTQGEVKLSVQSLATGLYLAVLEADGHPLATRKISVTH